MSIEKKHKILKNIFWDYNTDFLPLDEIIKKNFKSIDDYGLNLILNRMLERLNWYELLDILGLDLIKQFLTPEIIDKLRNKEMKERYETIRRILFKEPLPISGWDPEYLKRVKTTLLSNRWYCS